MNLRTKVHTGMKWLPLAVAAIGMTGCVSQRYVDDLETLYRRCQEQIIDLRAELDEKDTEIDVLRSTLKSHDPELLAKLQKALSSHDQLTRALDDAENRLRSIGSGPLLEPEIDTALIELAESSNLITYESDRGMVKFQSDLTFALGSADVNPKATDSLKKLANILNSPTGKKYTARVVGHTDNVPIGKPATRAKHPTNEHLAVHRAIAVKNELKQAGVTPSRVGIAGYGEYRPIASNGPKGNEANRRVEVFLIRPSTTAAEPAAANSPAKPTAIPESIETPKTPKKQQASQPAGAFK